MLRSGRSYGVPERIAREARTQILGDGGVIAEVEEAASRCDAAGNGHAMFGREH